MPLINTRRFVNASTDEDFQMDAMRYVRTLTGRITKGRYQVLRRYARRLSNHAPYGISPNGYAYRCGCSHDCCGCLTGESGWLQISRHWKGFKIEIHFIQNFNY